MAANAIGGHLAKKSAQSQAQQNYLDTQKQIDANMAGQKAWQDKMQSDPGFAAMMQSAMGPQTTSTSSSSVSDQSQGYVGQQGTLDEMMGAAKNAVGSANVLQAQQLAALNRNISGQQQQQNTAIGNIAAARGVDPAIARLGMNQGINNQRLNAELGVAQQGRENTRQAWGDVNSLLERYKTQHTTSRGNSTTTGGPDIGAYLGMQQLLRPGERPVVQRQAV
jgi:hypothetical protein